MRKLLQSQIRTYRPGFSPLSILALRSRLLVDTAKPMLSAGVFAVVIGGQARRPRWPLQRTQVCFSLFAM